MSLNIFDPYNFRSRVSVILFYMLPFLFDALVMYGEGLSISENAIIVIVMIMIFQTLLIICRSNKPRKNYASDMLMVGSKLNHQQRKRYYRKLASFEPEFSSFGLGEEHWEKSITEELCDSVVAWLRAKTRDKSLYSLVFEENINYGFIKNMRRIKPIGLVLNIIAVLLIIITDVFCTGNQFFSLDCQYCILEVTLHLAEVLFLLICVSRQKEEILAEKYSMALLETIDTIIN